MVNWPQSINQSICHLYSDQLVDWLYSDWVDSYRLTNWFNWWWQVIEKSSLRYSSWALGPFQMPKRVARPGSHCYNFYVWKPQVLLKYSAIGPIDRNSRMLEIQSESKECREWEPKKPEIRKFGTENALMAMVSSTQTNLTPKRGRNCLSEFMYTYKMLQWQPF